MIPRLRFTRAYHTTAKRYMRDLNARPPCIFDVVQSGSIAKAAAQLRVKQPSVSDRSPQGIRPTIYGDAFIECGVAVFEHWLVTVLWISLSQRAREDSHADFRIIAKGIYQNSGRCRRRDLWPCCRC
jgi:hypothetical protein